MASLVAHTPADAGAPEHTEAPSTTPSPFVEKFGRCTDPKQALKACEVLAPPHVWSGPMSPKDVARELFAGCEAGEGVVPVDLLGQCLGHHHEFWQGFAGEFPTFFNFEDMGIVEAIRMYLWQFRLVREPGSLEHDRDHTPPRPPPWSPTTPNHRHRPTARRVRSNPAHSRGLRGGVLRPEQDIPTAQLADLNPH